MSDPILAPEPEVDTDDRRTPRWLFDALDHRYGFYWDLAATRENSLCGEWYFGPGSTHGEDALVIPWAEYLWSMGVPRTPPPGPVAWLNPPFSRERGGILAWIQKAEAEAVQGLATILLISADTSTEYFRYCHSRLPCEFTKRLTYDNAPLDGKGRKSPAKFGSMIVTIWPPIDGVYYVG